jgi:hypothetical protein
MGDILTVPRVVPMWDMDIFWPPVQNMGEGTAWNQNGQGRFAGTSLANVWAVNGGAATRNMQRIDQALCGALTAGGGAFSDAVGGGLSGAVPLTAIGLAGSYAFPPWRRCFIWEFVVRWGIDAANTVGSGIAMCPSDGTSPGWPELGWKGFGIYRNGVGQWIYRSRAIGGVIGETVVLAWPTAITTFATVQFVVLSATGGGPATMQLRLNDRLVLTRRWNGIDPLPLYNDGNPLLNAGVLLPFLRNGDTVVGGIMYVAQCRFRIGAFDPDGNPV